MSPNNVTAGYPRDTSSAKLKLRVLHLQSYYCDLSSFQNILKHFFSAEMSLAFFFSQHKSRMNSISPMYFSPFEDERRWKNREKSLIGTFSHLHSPCHSQRSLTLNETEQRKGKFRFCRRLGCGEKNPSGGMIGAQNLFIENGKLPYLEAPQMWLLRWVKWVKMFLF